MHLMYLHFIICLCVSTHMHTYNAFYYIDYMMHMHTYITYNKVHIKFMHTNISCC